MLAVPTTCPFCAAIWENQRLVAVSVKKDDYGNT